QALLEETGLLVQAVLENESTLEQRVAREQERLRQELRELELQSRLRLYLERGLERGAMRTPRVDLKR
ncbi:MAG TPA: hypothetical protein VL359_02835, partial [bacterium]|nr:hypothetical protein [bacterium]